MNEEHIIAAILTAGLINQDRGGAVLLPIDAVEIYGKCLLELIENIRPQRSTEEET
jgi:hypothetical protein